MPASRLGLLLASLASLLASTNALAAPPGCVAARSLATLQNGEFAGVPAAQIAAAADVYERISQAGRIQAELYFCSSRQVNAFASDAAGKPVVLVNAGLLALTDGNRDQLAAVLGHELGHIQMRHSQARAQAARESLMRAQREAAHLVNRGVDRTTAIRAATHDFLVDFTQFSQVAEREADDAGFKLLMLAGFKAAGQREIAEKMLKAAGTRERAYFSTHPGWAERAGYSAILQRNEEFRAEAEKHAAARDFKSLALVVDRWQKAVPESGAAAFYRGIIRWMAARPTADVSTAFEDAVAFFDGDGLSRISQEYQPEMRQATVMLCVTLFREGRKTQALHCLDRLQSRADIEQFKKLTGWSEFILVARPAPTRSGTLFSSRNGDGAVLMSNCGHVADANGMRAVKPWTAARSRDTAAEPEAMQCSPNMCNCEPVDLDELLRSVGRAP
jgi:Zn-dependent protease with chaperone function